MPAELEPLANRVIGAAIEVHRALGPGLLESAYEACLARELVHLGIPFVQQHPLERIEPIHTAQVLTYLRLSGLKLALLINFNIPLLREGLKRVIL